MNDSISIQDSANNKASEPENNIPRVSVIIPLYNKAPYIKRALDSVLAQTVEDFEIVVVNDGSTDGGENIVTEYADSRVRLINQKNQGVSAARNHGVDAARAELVAFLDADDEWLPEFLETILRLREKYPDAGLYGTGFKVMSSSGMTILRAYEPSKEDRIIESYFAAKMKFCNHRGGQLISTSGMAIDKNAFHKVGGFQEGAKQSEDRALRGIIALYYDVAYSPNICVVYNNNTINNSSHIYEFLKDPFSEYIKSIPENDIKSRIDYIDIIDFNEANQLYIIQRNIDDCPEHKKEILEQIHNIQLPHNILQKYKLYIYCKIPVKIYRTLHNIKINLIKVIK